MPEGDRGVGATNGQDVRPVPAMGRGHRTLGWPSAGRWPGAPLRTRAARIAAGTIAARTVAVGTIGMALFLGAPPPEAGAQDQGDLERYQRRLEIRFRQLDSNGDGRLSPGEVKGRPFLETNFQRLDQGGKGYLVPADMSLPPAQRHFLGERLRQAFERADANRDGRLCGSEMGAFPWLLQNGPQADRNGDGCVTLEELWALRRALAPRPQRDE